MRRRMLAMVLVGLMAMPVMAQFGFFGGQQTGDSLLNNKSVQKELKLSEKETEALGKIQRESFSKMKDAFKDAEGDQDKIREAMQKVQKDTAKALAKFKEGLTKEQKTRFAQLEYHVAAQTNDVNFLLREDIQKGLKFTDKQKKLVKSTDEELKKDVKELFDDAKESGDFSGIREKLPKIRKEAYTKVSKSFDDDQKKAWKEKAGKAFEYKPDQFGFKKKKADDDN
jgi:hypothetical protein